MQGEHDELYNQVYSGKFCGKELMGNQDFSDNYSTQNASYGNDPRFQCTCLTDPCTDFWREMLAVR